MNIRTFTSLLTISLVLMTTSIAFASPSTDEKDIRAGYQMITDGYAEHDPLLALMPYVKDESLVIFDLVEPFKDQGYQRSLEKTKGFMSNTVGPMVLEYSDIEATSACKAYAFSSAKIHIMATIKGGQEINVTARVTHVWKKIGGKWLIIVEHVSTPLDWKMNI
jgi:ketosteroid isomerase-like protein